MASLTISCSDEVQRLIEQKMVAGQYASENEVLLDALKALNLRDELDAKIQIGVDQLARGEATTYDSTALSEKFARIRAKILAGESEDHE